MARGPKGWGYQSLRAVDRVMNRSIYPPMAVDRVMAWSIYPNSSEWVVDRSVYPLGTVDRSLAAARDGSIFPKRNGLLVGT